MASGAMSAVGVPMPYAGSGIAIVGGQIYVSFADDTIYTMKSDGTGPVVYAGKHNQYTPPMDGGRLTNAILSPAALATDGTNLFFVDSNHLIREIDATGMVTTLAGDPTASDILDGTGQGAHFSFPYALACDGANLYTLDGAVTTPNGNVYSVVRRIAIASGKVDTIAGAAGMLGAVDAVGTTARFAGMTGITSDGRSLFISDRGQGPGKGDLHSPSLRQLDLATNRVTTFAGTRGTWTTINGLGTASILNAPTYIVADTQTKKRFVFDMAEGILLQIN